MKAKSYIKAILSGFVWGLGQLFNKQYIKALFFFIVFSLFIGIELGTSKYFYKEETPHQLAYEKISGDDFGDRWFGSLPVEYYNHLKTASNPLTRAKIENLNFEKYLTEVLGVRVENNQILDNTNLLFTEEKALDFLAQEFVQTSPESYTNLSTGDIILSTDFDISNYKALTTRESLYFDETSNKFYFEKVTDIDKQVVREYIQKNLFTTDIIQDPEVLTSSEGLIKLDKTNKFYQDSASNIYIDATLTKKINAVEEKEAIVLKLNYDNKYEVYNGEMDDLTRTTILGPIYANDNSMFEYYKAGLVTNGVIRQYNDSTFMYTFRKKVDASLSQLGGSSVTSQGFEKLMLKVYFTINPEVRDLYLEFYDNFFYDRAGMFVKGYWSVATLGVAVKQDYTSYLALSDAMIGTRNGENSLVGQITLVESIPVLGHVSTMLLIEGLIAVLLSLFFLIFMVWSIRDAYRVSEQKRKEEEVLNSRKYFKSVWDNGFEYIVLSPAIFVLAFISIMPILFGFIIAFTSISGQASMVDNFNYVGLGNFAAIFNFNSGLGESFGKAFWGVLWWTIVWAIFSTFTVFFGGFIQALILNSERVVFRKLWRTILILPWAIPGLLSQMVFSVMFNDVGFINQLLRDVGAYDIFIQLGILGKPFAQMTGFLRHFWLGDANIRWFTNAHNVNFVKATLIVVNIWLGFPYFMALMTGIMTAIDRNLYEAADIDGATGFQKLKQITIPLVLFSTAPILIMSFSGNFNNFGVIYFITGGGPNTGLASNGYAGSTDILISWMYSLTVDHSIYNMASVFSVLVFLFVGSVTAWNLSRTRAFMED